MCRDTAQYAVGLHINAFGVRKAIQTGDWPWGGKSVAGRQEVKTRGHGVQRSLGAPFVEVARYSVSYTYLKLLTRDRGKREEGVVSLTNNQPVTYLSAVFKRHTKRCTY